MAQPALDLPVRALYFRGLYRARGAMVGQVGAYRHGSRIR